MSKLMIVEDDLALREIYSIRLTAEGYTVIVAGDGEEALALAVSEKPDLILSDVMMPKISGFDMLDIIRATPELNSVKVVMMTALSSDEQRARGEALGADRYLVKSQVGIEDVVNVIHEVLGDKAVAVPQPTSPAATPASDIQYNPLAVNPQYRQNHAAPATSGFTNPATTYTPFALAAPVAPTTPVVPAAPVAPVAPAAPVAPVAPAPVAPVAPAPVAPVQPVAPISPNQGNPYVGQSGTPVNPAQ